MHAVFDRESSNSFACQPVQLSHLFNTIHGTNEVSLTASGDCIKVTAHANGEEPSSFLQTHMTVLPQDLDRFDLLDSFTPSELIFCVREVRAFVTLCEQMGGVIGFYFTQSGWPVMVVAESGDSSMNAEMIVATLENRELEQKNHSKEEEEEENTPTNTNIPPPNQEEKRKDDKEPWWESNSQDF